MQTGGRILLPQKLHQWRRDNVVPQCIVRDESDPCPFGQRLPEESAHRRSLAKSALSVRVSFEAVSDALVLGLDCGGSTVRARVENLAGEVVFEGLAGPANLASTPEAVLKGNLAQAVRGMPPAHVAVGCFAGLLTPQDRERAIRILQDVTGIPSIDARPDFHATISACSPDTTACLIVGTGSLVASRIDGAIMKSGGGGPLLGDDGGGFSLGREALRLTLVSELFDVSPTLRDRLEECFGTSESLSVLAAIYRSEAPASKVAELAATVIQDAVAESPAPYATEATIRASSFLAETVAAHLQKTSPDARILKVVRAGGIWSISEQFSAWLETRISESVARALPRVGTILWEPLAFPPVVGACRLARELL